MTLKEELEQFHGTEHYHEVIPNVKRYITDGVKYFAQKAEAFWLITDIICVRGNEHLKNEPFIVVNTKRTRSGVVVQYEDGNGHKLYKEVYPYSKLPDDENFTLWVEKNVVLLPSEH